MVKPSKGLRRNARSRLKRGLRQKFTSGKFMQEFKAGDKVIIKIEPSSQASIPHLRTKGKIGDVIGKRGKSYAVKIRLGGSTREVITKPEHLKLHA